ncbi:MAG TPA: P1 family peptidase [Acidimicrobiales bacterium]|nr:P1 family peptidase [Acidimicrobiales bacterium]
MLTDVPGVRVGHWTDARARTGCTVVLLPEGAVASGEVRGGAPGTREWDLLSPERLVQRVDAVVLTGGSAFGLAACDGVVAALAEQGVGFPTRAGPVPIVVGVVLFDLGVGDPSVRPGPAEGRAACEAAIGGRIETGPIGAGAGATVGSWRGPELAGPGGIGTATVRHGEVIVSALMAVNAYGDVVPAGVEPESVVGLDALVERMEAGAPAAFEQARQQTTIGVVATNAALDKRGCLLVAQSAHDGLARALEPVHTTRDGDAIVAVATGAEPAPLDAVRAMAARAVASAVRQAVTISG